MKVGIFELQHFEVAYPLIRFFDMPGNELTIFTNDQCYESLKVSLGEDTDRFKWLIKSRNDSKYNFIRKAFRVVKEENHSIFFLSTVEDIHFVYALEIQALTKVRVILTVHDINCLFKSKPSLNFRKAVQYLGKNLLVKSVREFNVLAESLVPYLRSVAGEKKKIHQIPGAVFENASELKEISEPLRIVVPGAVDTRRRNYEDVFSLASNLSQRNIKCEMILAGEPIGPAGKNIVIRAMNSYYGEVSIRCFQTFIPQADYDEVLDSAHFLFIPSIIKTSICDGIDEEYGLTKSSGNISDIIKHAKPYLAPAALILPSQLKHSGLAYHKTEDIIEFLLQMIRSPDRYAVLQQQAKINSQEFTAESIRRRNPDIFGEGLIPNLHSQNLTG